MEVVLNKIGNQTDLKLINGLFDAVQEAKAAFQLPVAQSCPFERRQKCLACFSIALQAAAKPKFAVLAFEGIQLILRDHQALGSEQRTPQGQTRAEQLLAMLAGIPNWRETPATQCQALSLLVQLISSTEISVQLKEVLSGLEICKQTFDGALVESSSVRPAARAALTQMLNSYVQNRLAVADGGDKTEIGALMDVTALLTDLMGRMGAAIEDAVNQQQQNVEAKSAAKPAQPLLLPLDALFSVLSALEPAQLELHQPLLNSLKGELLPVVICHLHGSARSPHAGAADFGSAKQRIGSLLRRGVSRQSTDTLPATMSPSGIALDGAQSARSFYQVVEQLLRLFTPMALSPSSTIGTNSSTTNEMLFLLEELWRSALLAPPTAKRAEAMRLAKRLCNNGASFCALLRLSAASCTDAFWLMLLECLEECCTGGDQKLASDSLRTLSALLTAIHQMLFESLPEAEFSAEFYAKLAKLEGNGDGEEEEKITENGQDKANSRAEQRRRSSAVPVVPPPPEPMAKAFLDAFLDQLPKWQNCVSASELDAKVQHFSSVALLTLKKMERDTASNDVPMAGRGSRTSTPEDSEAEEDHQEQQQQRTNQLAGLLTEIEVYGLANATILDLQRQQGPAADCEWLKARIEKSAAALGSGQPMLTNGGPFSAVFASASNSGRHLLQQVLRSIHAQKASLKWVPLSVNRHLRFFFPDPLATNPSESSQSEQHRLLLARWLRHRLHNCWGSIVRMLGHFPIRKGGGGAEEGRFATVEALGSLVHLASKLGMPAELGWAMESIGEKVCALEELREAIQRSTAKRGGGEDAKAARRFCDRAELLAIQVLMENAGAALALEPGAAKHIVRCVQFLWELERWHFKLAKATIDAIYEPPSLPVPPSRSGHNSPIGQLIGSTLPAMGELSSNELARLMDQFLVLIDRLFSDASSQLPMDSFGLLLCALANASEDNLLYSDSAPTESSAQLLQRIFQLVCATAQAPLIAQLASWCRIKDHIVQCASSNSIPSEIGRRTVDGLQDLLEVLLHWEYGEPMSGDQHRRSQLDGWNGLLFDVFPTILGAKDDNKKCSNETGQQIGQVLLTFVEQNAELLGSGWPRLFAAVQLIAQQGFDDGPGPLFSLAIEVLEKFVAIPKPAVLMVAFSHFTEALVHCIGLVCATDSKDADVTFLDRLLALLERSQRVAFDRLFGSVVPFSVLPKGLAESADSRLAAKWKCFSTAADAREGDRAEDYLHLLADLKTEIGHRMANKGQNEMPAALGQWLDGAQPQMIATVGTLEEPWRQLTLPTDRIVAENVLFMLERLMQAILTKQPNGQFPTATRSARLVLNVADFLRRISAEMGSEFAIFAICSSLLPDLKRSVGSSLAGSQARSLKQFLGILCPHPSVLELLEESRDGEDAAAAGEEWRISLLQHLLDLAVRCVAKGGTLSLAGSALLRRLIACADADPAGPMAARMAAACANSVWMASRYALFPVRMLIGQFFVDSTDFSGDLGQMKVSYRLGLDPSEVEERVDNVQQLANQVFRLEGQLSTHRGDEPAAIGAAEDGTQQKAEEGEEADEEERGGAHFPAKFAYLFLFENSGEEAGAKKLSMGLDELVDSLLCQQLLVQLTAEQLGSQKFLASPAAVHGPLLASLNATLTICDQFHARPGLQSLLQKLTGLPSAANLWTLSLACSHALSKYALGVAACNADERESAVKWLLQLLEAHRTFTPTAAAKSAANSRRSLSVADSDHSAKDAFQQRANPFIRHQPSQDSQTGTSRKRTEAAKVRILALGKLLSLMLADCRKLENSGTEFRHLLAEEVRKMTDGWAEEAEEKAKEVVEDFARKLME